MHLPIYVKNILSALEQAGHECYCVGGCVRNFLLSLPISDYDITTSALPTETIKALSKFKVIETGIKHGTVTAISDSQPIEITTYRSENTYSDHRHPDTVTFSSDLKSDLSRRDFTINAMAFNEESGIIDIFGGQDDIKRHILRTVGNPDERFNEDALRILRALRFGSVLGFDIEEKTSESIRNNFKLLSFVSRERIYSELSKLICGKNASRIIESFPEVLAFILGENLISPDVIKKAAASIPSLPQTLHIRFAALLQFTPLCCAEEILISLKVDRETIKKTLAPISSLSNTNPINRIEIKKYLRDYGVETTIDSLILKGVHNDQMQKEIADILNKGECYKLSDLKISGDDLISLGIKGRQIGRILSQLLNLVIEEKLPNSKEILISHIKNTLLN